MSVWQVGDVFRIRGDSVETKVVQIDDDGAIHWAYVRLGNREPATYKLSLEHQQSLLLIERDGVRRRRAVALC